MIVAEHERDAMIPAGRAPTRQHRLLVVDDELLVAHDLTTALKAAGYTHVDVSSEEERTIDMEFYKEYNQKVVELQRDGKPIADDAPLGFSGPVEFVGIGAKGSTSGGSMPSTSNVISRTVARSDIRAPGLSSPATISL